MDDLKTLLAGRNHTEPPEIQIIKQYVQDHFKAPSQVAIHPKQITISVRGAALAGSLRMKLHELAEACQTDKRLIIRIL